MSRRSRCWRWSAAPCSALKVGDSIALAGPGRAHHPGGDPSGSISRSGRASCTADLLLARSARLSEQSVPSFYCCLGIQPDGRVSSHPLDALELGARYLVGRAMVARRTDFRLTS